MNAVTQTSLGGPEVLHLAEVACPTPGIGELLVRVRAAGVNPADAMYRQNGAFGGAPPFILGWDVSGVVEQVGLGVTIFRPGDEVFGLLPFPRGAGAYAQFAVGPARAFVHKPERLSHIEAAALPLAGLTAWQALVETAHIESGMRVVITGAAGGVGHLAVQIAHALGAETIAVASAAHEDHLRGLGADDVIDYRTVDFSRTLRGVDVVLDVIGDDGPEKAVSTVAPGGIIVSTLPQSLAAAEAVAADAQVRLAGLFVESDRVGLGALVDLVNAGSLRPTIATTYPLAEASIAHATKHGPGKVVLTVN